MGKLEAGKHRLPGDTAGLVAVEDTLQGGSWLVVGGSPQVEEGSPQEAVVGDILQGELAGKPVVARSLAAEVGEVGSLAAEVGEVAGSLQTIESYRTVDGNPHP